jgi:hypothetical protein
METHCRKAKLSPMREELLMLVPLVLVVAQSAASASAAQETRDADFAQLPFSGAVLYNNVFNKGSITGARQEVFRQDQVGGWAWDWPEAGDPRVKAYPEVILGRSPWGEARAGDRLPCALAAVRQRLDFAFDAEGTGSWCTSFDFWITSSPDPTPKDIVANLTIWTQRHALEPSYKGQRETLRIAGRVYEAILQTPAEAPGNAWPTLCLIDSEPRTSGSLDLAAFMKVLIARGLAQPTHFLATAELGSEVAHGKGRLTLRRFRLR